MTLQSGAVRPTGASASAIQHHYDVGNDFYALWLDDSRTYSCGLWYEDEDLNTAQLNKLDWILERAGADKAGRLLDVGCGWGSALHRATHKYRVERAVGLSMSQAQVDWLRERAWPGVDVRLESWVDHVPTAPYDAITSIGAFEHFARLDQTEQEKVAGYRQFFQFCYDALAPGGRLGLQTIAYGTASRSDFSPFFAEHIFPESDLPHLSEIVAATHGLFEIELLRNDRLHYARTARAWLNNLRSQRAAAIAQVGPQATAMFEKYLGLLLLGFHSGAMRLLRLGLQRIDRRPG